MALRSWDGMSKIQELYNACSMIFTCDEDPSPTPDEIKYLQDLLGTIEGRDVGIDGSDDDDNIRAEQGMMCGSKIEEITYVHIYQCDEFSMGVFCFPAGAKIPLHDHPEMVVLSKVLYGSLSLKSYDWVKPPLANQKRGLARVAVDDDVLDVNCPASVLYPRSGGNMHCFTALTPAAMLDVLTPPYSDEEGRPSTYYSEIFIPSLSDFAILERKEMVPEDFVVIGAPYVGPKLILYEDVEEDDGMRIWRRMLT